VRLERHISSLPASTDGSHCHPHHTTDITSYKDNTFAEKSTQAGDTTRYK